MMESLKCHFKLLVQRKGYILIMLILITSNEILFSQKNDSIKRVELKEVEIISLRIDYKKFLQSLIKANEVKFEEKGMDNLVYDYSYKCISNKTLKENGRAIVSIVGKKNGIHTINV